MMNTNNNQPLISVIVPVYKVEQYLRRCVDSLLGQSWENLEIILVDDGSPDGCGKICDEYAVADKRVFVIHKENGGLSSARNAGINVAHGEFFAFVDSDDWVDCDIYERLYYTAIKYDALMVYCGRIDEYQGSSEQGICPIREELISGEEMVRRIFTWENVDSAAWDKLYHHSLFEDIRYPVNLIGEDVPTTYRLALKAKRVASFPKREYHYSHRPLSITTMAVSSKDFQYVSKCKEIENDIATNYPSLIEQANYLYLRAVGLTLQNLEISGNDIRKMYHSKEIEYRRMLRDRLGFILTSKLVPRKERRDFALMAVGLYRILRLIYHTL